MIDKKSEQHIKTKHCDKTIMIEADNRVCT